MDKARRKFTLGAGLVVGSVCVGAYLFDTQYSRRDAPITLRFSHVAADNTPKGRAANFLSEMVSRKTGGEVHIAVYPNSTLYKDGEELEALQLGTVDIIAPSMSKLASLGFSGFEVFDLPYLFEDYDALHKVTEGPIGATLLQSLGRANVMGMAFWDNGFKQMSATRPLREVSDFSGLRMRIQPSRILGRQMRLLGADAIDMALADVKDALLAKLIDGCENPASNFDTQGLSPLQPYLTVSNHGYLGNALMFNQESWRQLPRRLTRVIQESIGEATRYANQIARAENEAALQRIEEAGHTTVLTLSARQTLAWKQALAPIYSEIQDPEVARLAAKVRSSIF